ncbi:MAG: acyl-CoA mutase large subunit family protein [Candidatus Thorarchaeota archaeon]|nr:MAG: methylmalonyl-CoA mutase [Candidatus Thorarchaeota archaeon]RLI59469.1 MAG: methylmalonyl-CoA mutase [Candidatus Thorarchaeota archaeon]
MAKDKASEIDEIRKAREEWEKNTLSPHEVKHPQRRKKFVTTSSKPVRILYTPADIPDFDYLRDLGFPSQYPYTRGVQPNAYRGRLWTMRQFAGMGTAEESNARYKFLLANGQTGLSVAFHLPTIFARDSDHPFSLGEVGKLGVAIDTLADMEILFDGIPLDKVTTSMTINAPASILLAMYMVAAQKQGVSSHQIGGTIQNDLLKEYMAQKSWILAPEPSLRIIGDIMEYCATNIPRWNTISISGYHIREAGSTAVQELAFTLLNGMEYVKVGKEHGLDVDVFAPRLSFFFNAHNDIFEEVAKYRAARRIWAREMKETFGAKKERSLWMRFHTQTAGCSLTAQQPMVNIVRTAYQALAAVLGGTQSLHTNSMDEALCLPTEDAVRVALRTQQVLAHESGAANTIDPLAGSYYVEALTNEMEEEAYKYFDKVESLGGVVAAIEKGFFQQEIANAAYRYQREIEKKERIIVGVNEYVQEDEQISIPVLKISPEVERSQVERLNRVRRERDNKKVEEALDGLRKASEGSENVMPHIVAAVKAYASVGEIFQIWRDLWGEWEEPKIF